MDILKCTKYINPHGTIFLDCPNKRTGMILNFSQSAYPEEIKFCMFCGYEYEDDQITDLREGFV